ncbi:hypothetical protein [Streptomyces tanashiensis]|uniref:Uncharacterized protein n=1 Tax=Streptomyces tanashiensis TaxID=67367 RepID=A0ABY6R8B2_9ACTN|nr:hypothetical protein [Streptomyces tanashiensis]UZX26310.1 hypothetical protein LDH80_39235 [Streptomyces tanashiensis]
MSGFTSLRKYSARLPPQFIGGGHQASAPLSRSDDRESHLPGEPVRVRLPHLTAVDVDAANVDEDEDGVVVGRLAVPALVL